MDRFLAALCRAGCSHSLSECPNLGHLFVKIGCRLQKTLLEMQKRLSHLKYLPAQTKKIRFQTMVAHATNHPCRNPMVIPIFFPLSR